jgi:hypothetical protein
MKLQQAQKKQVKLRIGISGPSGFGKTYSALLLAYGMTGDYSKIAIIDTENGSASLYSELGNYNTLTLEAPFSPEKYIQAIKLCEEAKMEVIIIDSITHEWNGKGGCLDIQEQLGGRFQDWAKVTPRHQAFIDKILQSNTHMITTTRRKVDYSMDTDSNGRTRVIKHGMKEIQREGYEYELSVNFEIINDNHLVSPSKDRTGLFMNKPEFIISPATGKHLIKWCNNDADLKKVKNEIKQCETLEGLRHIYAKHPNLKNQILNDVMEQKANIEAIQNDVIPNSEVIDNEPKTTDNGIETS